MGHWMRIDVDTASQVTFGVTYSTETGPFNNTPNPVNVYLELAVVRKMGGLFQSDITLVDTLPGERRATTDADPNLIIFTSSLVFTVAPFQGMALSAVAVLDRRLMPDGSNLGIITKVRRVDNANARDQDLVGPVLPNGLHESGADPVVTVHWI